MRGDVNGYICSECGYTEVTHECGPNWCGYFSDTIDNLWGLTSE